MRVGVADIVRNVGGPVIRARLDQQHLIGGILAQPRRERTAGGTAAGDDMGGVRHWTVSPGCRTRQAANLAPPRRPGKRWAATGGDGWHVHTVEQEMTPLHTDTVRGML